MFVSAESINIAFCFNNEMDAKNLSAKLTDLGPNIRFIIKSNFDEFLKAIAKVDKIDCFIIEEKYKECSSYDLIEKLKKSSRYKKSVMSLLTQDLSKLHQKFFDLDLHYVFDTSAEIRDVNLNLARAILKKLTPVIPKDFNVLVLDNGPDVLELISLYLKDLGHTNIDLCQSVKEAKLNLVEKDYDLLLLDWNLDDGTCIDLIEFKNKSGIGERTKSALSVVITGRDDVDDIMTLLRYGVKDYIIKPFDFTEFEEKISYAVEKHLRKE